MLYGAPVWAEEVNEFPNMGKKLRAIQRKISLRVVRAYRTVSLEVALVLACNPPFELQVDKLRAVYLRRNEGIKEQIRITEYGLQVIRSQEKERMMGKWKKELTVKAGTGRGFNMDILSCMKEWECREHGELTYQATQLITGHGCFKGYTNRIGKTDNSKCSFCGNDWEDNLHVLFDCDEWREHRERLIREFGGGGVESLGAIMRGMVSNPRKWAAVLEFVSKVMDRKSVVEREEEAERRREKLIRETVDLLRGQRMSAGRIMGRPQDKTDHR